MNSPLVEKANQAAAVLRNIAEQSAENMGQRMPDLDAHADLAEVVAHLASLAEPVA